MNHTNVHKSILNLVPNKIDVLSLEFDFGNIFNNLPETSKNILQICFKHNAFISGGFARYFHNKNFFYTNLLKKHIDAYRYYGDIDIFFHNINDYHGAINELSCSHHNGNKTLFSLKMTDANYAIQLVDCIFGSPTDVMSTFDFYNCMFSIVKIDKKFILIKEKNNDLLEDRKILSVNFQKAPFLFGRMRKYFLKYGYKQINFNKSNNDLFEDIIEMIHSLPTISSNININTRFTYIELLYRALIDVGFMFDKNDFFSCLFAIKLFDDNFEKHNTCISMRRINRKLDGIEEFIRRFDGYKNSNDIDIAKDISENYYGKLIF